VNYYSDEKAAELIKIKPGLGIRDVRLEKGLENCDLCGNSLFRQGYTEFQPEPHAFTPPKLQHAPPAPTSKPAESRPKAPAPAPAGDGADLESLVQKITDQVMTAMNGAANGREPTAVKGRTYASGLSGGV
jgi:L-fuculose-phosphate aldolase